MERRLYIIAYDIRHPHRLRRMLSLLKGFASGRQKSVFECHLSAGELRSVIRSARRIIDAEHDRMLVLRHRNDDTTRVLGSAVAPEDPDWFYIG